MRNTTFELITAVTVIGSVNAILISILIAMYWPANFAERTAAGTVLLPFIWIVIVMTGFTRTRQGLFIRTSFIIATFMSALVAVPFIK